MALGLAEDQVHAFRGVTDEDEFISALESVDTDIQSLALSLYEITGLTIPRSKYTVFDDSKDFEAALRGDMDQWELYLHPSQRYIVELPVQHRIAVQGSAGTGKTVCAWHRLGFLASQGHSVGFVCANKAILEVSRDMLERLVQGALTDCYFLIPNSRDELVQIAEEVEHIVFDEGQEFTPVWFSHSGSSIVRQEHWHNFVLRPQPDRGKYPFGRFSPFQGKVKLVALQPWVHTEYRQDAFPYQLQELKRDHRILQKRPRWGASG